MIEHIELIAVAEFIRRPKIRHDVFDQNLFFREVSLNFHLKTY